MDVKLKGKHLIMFSKLVYKLSFKPDFKGKSQEEFGFDLFWGLLSHAHLSENELWEIVRDILGKTPESCKELELDELKEVITIIYEKIVGYFKKPTME